MFKLLGTVWTLNALCPFKSNFGQDRDKFINLDNLPISLLWHFIESKNLLQVCSHFNSLVNFIKQKY